MIPMRASANAVQYFEMGGSRALVAGEWKAVCKHDPGADFETEPWELYHLAQDRSECHDLAAEQPDRLAELVALWWEEAERHGALPLDDRMIELFGARFRPNSPHPADRRYVYRPPMSPMPAQASAAIGGRDADITAVRRAGSWRGRCSLRHRHAELGHLGVRAGRPARARLQRVRRPRDRRVLGSRCRRASRC